VKLTSEQLDAIQILADMVYVWELDAEIVDIASMYETLQTVAELSLACPQRFRRALNLGHMMLETGVLAPDGHGAKTVLAALELVARERDMFEKAFTATEGCTGCM
jgi:hypothetical protein